MMLKIEGRTRLPQNLESILDRIELVVAEAESFHLARVDLAEAPANELKKTMETTDDAADRATEKVET
eukprot:3571190-Prorocentrum_lima.AAC.1